MYRVVLLCLLLWAGSSSANTLYIGQLTHHFNKDTDITRESHALVIYEHIRSRVLVGYWRNSFDRHTLALGRNFYKQSTPYGVFGLKAGLATGYHIPVFAALYYDAGPISINWVPGEVVGVGFKFDL